MLQNDRLDCKKLEKRKKKKPIEQVVLAQATLPYSYSRKTVILEKIKAAK